MRMSLKTVMKPHMKKREVMIAKETRWLWPLADVEEEEVGVWAMTAMGEIFASRFSNFD
jgi:hypothetical protein